MALKNWKKVGVDRWKKPDGSITVIHNANEFNLGEKGFAVVSKIGNRLMGTRHTFSKKSQALAFAKKYMESH